MSVTRPRLFLGVGAFLLAGGAALAGHAIGHGIPSKAAPTVVPAAYAETCSTCPSGARIDSVEVQARENGTLFVLRGSWPASVDELHSSVRLVANDIEVVLKPHGSQNVFDVEKATRGTAAMAKDSVAAGIQSGALLISFSVTDLKAPVQFEVGLWNGSSYTGRLPGAGTLAWDGQGAPHR
jgi:hypothetical protein